MCSSPQRVLCDGCAGWFTEGPGPTRVEPSAPTVLLSPLDKTQFVHRPVQWYITGGPTELMPLLSFRSPTFKCLSAIALRLERTAWWWFDHVAARVPSSLLRSVQPLGGCQGAHWAVSED